MDIKSMVDEKIAELNFSAPEPLKEAVDYAFKGNGKRVRPILMLEICRILGGDADSCIPFACAIEMIHASSLVHDDLPCIDNDDMRRGKPSCHKAFGEGMAVLAGDALMAYAFEVAAAADVEPIIALECVKLLAVATGGEGMLGGQALDIGVPEDYQKMCMMKTGALFMASALIGATVARATMDDYAAIGRYARDIGLAFQIQDDLADNEGDWTQEDLDKLVDRANTELESIAGKEAAHELTGRIIRK